MLAAYSGELMRIEGVEGVGRGVCDGRPCIRVFVRSAADAARVPTEIEGYEVSVEVTGRFEPRTGP